MDKEREPIFTNSGYSEKEMDKAMDNTKNLNQVKAGNIFDPKKPNKKKIV